MFTGRALATGARRRLCHVPQQQSARGFHASTRSLVKAGDAVPNVELVEDSPGNKVSIANELKKNGLVIGVPAAFSKVVLRSQVRAAC